MLAEVERLLLEEEPVVPFPFYKSKNLVSKRVQGWRDNLLDRHLARYLSVGRGGEAWRRQADVQEPCDCRQAAGAVPK